MRLSSMSDMHDCDHSFTMRLLHISDCILCGQAYLHRDVADEKRALVGWAHVAERA